MGVLCHAACLLSGCVFIAGIGASVELGTTAFKKAEPLAGVLAVFLFFRGGDQQGGVGGIKQNTQQVI